MNSQLKMRLRVIMLAVVAIALSISGGAQTDYSPPTIGDMSIRHVVVHDFATFAGAVVTSLMFTPDSQSLACGFDDGSVLLLNIGDGAIIRELPSHDQAVTSVNISPNSQWLASSGKDGRVHVTDLLDDANSLSLSHQGIVYEVEFSPQGTYLASAGEEKRIRLWNVSTWEELDSIEGHTGTIYALGISPAEDLIVTGSGDTDPSIRLWNLQTGELLHNDLYEGTVTDIEYSPRRSDHHATVASSQRLLTLWDVDEGSMLHIIGPFGGATNDIAYSSVGNTLVAVCEDGTLFFTTMSWWTEKRRIQFEEPLVAVAFSPSRQYIACSDVLGHIYLLYIPQ
jgi:WD40 repeat protein